METDCWHRHHFFILSIFLVEREKYEQRRQKSYRALLIELWVCYGQAKTQAARVYLVVVSGKQQRTDIIILSKNSALLDINLETPENAVVFWSRFWQNAVTAPWFGDRRDASTEVHSFPAHLLPQRFSSPGGRHLPSVWTKPMSSNPWMTKGANGEMLAWNGEWEHSAPFSWHEFVITSLI